MNFDESKTELESEKALFTNGYEKALVRAADIEALRRAKELESKLTRQRKLHRLKVGRNTVLTTFPEKYAARIAEENN